MQWRKIGSFGTRTLIAWLAAIAGLALIFSMAMVYMLPSQPAWNSWATPISFFTTAFLLGSLAIGTAFVADYGYTQRKDSSQATSTRSILMRQSLRWIALAAIALLGVEFVVLPIYLGSLAAGPAVAVQSARLTIGEFGWVLILRLVLAFVGAGIYAVFLYQNALSAGQEKVLPKLVYVAFGLVFVAEVLGRVLFYMTHLRVGV
jgi:anaerobic dimethyl sulfoxide reductase subunit C (anchor subunit)